MVMLDHAVWLHFALCWYALFASVSELSLFFLHTAVVVS